MPKELGPQNVFMDRFVLEPKVQRVWGVPHATWFTLMGVGGGVFIVTRLLNLQSHLGRFIGLPVADLVSFAAIALGGVILMADLGRPMRFVRAVMNPRTSWISRGAIADFVFLIVGALLVLPDLKLGGAHPFSWLPWDAGAGNAIGETLEVITMLAGVVVMFYAGQVLAAPRSIPYWNSPAVPLQFLFSSVATSYAVVMLMEVIHDRPISSGQFGMTALSLGLLLAAVGWHLATKRDVPGKSNSLERLLAGSDRIPFLGGVVLLGSVVPAVLTLVAAGIGSIREAAAVASFVLLLPAGFLLRLVTLRVGIFPPVRTITPVAMPVAR
jgi:formate-dependent nitrite reductase membrane component NrfD